MSVAFQPGLIDNNATFLGTIRKSQSQYCRVYLLAMNSIQSCFSITKNTKSIFIRAQGRMTSLDGLRGLSLLMIIIFHTYFGLAIIISPENFFAFADGLPWYLGWAGHAEQSLEIFFVMSGFLITNILLQEQDRSGTINLKRFYWRRAMRLFPAAWLLMLITALLPSKIDKIYLWANVFYVNNYLEADQLHLPWLWSLAVEEQFYLLLPLVLILSHKFNCVFKTFLFLFGMSFVIRFGILLANPEYTNQPYAYITLKALPEYSSKFAITFYDNLYTRYGALIAGVLASYIYQNHRRLLEVVFCEKPYLSFLVVFSAIAWCGFSLYIPNGLTPSSDLMSPTQKLLFMTFGRNVFSICLSIIIIATLLEGSLLNRILNRFLSLPIWFPIAELSYSMFLFHVPILVIVFQLQFAGVELQEIIPTPSDLLQVAATTALCSFIVAYFVHISVEKPFINLRIYLDQRKKTKQLLRSEASAS